MKSSMFISFFAVLTLTATSSVFAQDIGPSGAGNVDVQNVTPFELDGPYAVFSNAKFSNNFIEGIKFEVPGEAEAIQKDTVDVTVGEYSANLTFLTASDNLMSIPFKRDREENARDLAKRLRAGESIDLTSCVIEVKTGNDTVMPVGGLSCKAKGYTRYIRCGKSDRTPGMRLDKTYVKKYFTQLSRSDFEKKEIFKPDFADYFGCTRTDTSTSTPGHK